MTCAAIPMSSMSARRALASNDPGMTSARVGGCEGRGSLQRPPAVRPAGAMGLSPVNHSSMPFPRRKVNFCVCSSSTYRTWGMRSPHFEETRVVHKSAGSVRCESQSMNIFISPPSRGASGRELLFSEPPTDYASHFMSKTNRINHLAFAIRPENFDVAIEHFSLVFGTAFYGPVDRAD